MKYLYERIQLVLKELYARSIKSRIQVDKFDFKECGYKHGNKLPVIDGSFKTYDSTNDYWGETKDRHAWFHKLIVLPKKRESVMRRLEISSGKEGWSTLNPQMLAYVNGEIRQGLDTNHQFLQFEDEEVADVFLYAYSGMNNVSEKLKFECFMTEIYSQAYGLYYDILVIMDNLKLLDESCSDYKNALLSLSEIVNILDFRDGEQRFLRSVEDARQTIKGLYLAFKNSQTVYAIGHTHIDIAWLWTIGQTREKAVRSFATVIELMDRYPDYKFMSSQAILYKIVCEDAPDLYQKIKQRVKEGRWEVEGGMWVEADCNLTSGESLIRQILYGKQFFKAEFGIDSKTLWLPDVFGYSAAMPQILTKSGIEHFVTSKISWNDTNTIPNDLFDWIGIDGSKLQTYFLTAQDYSREFRRSTTYVAHITPSMIKGTYERFQNKEITDKTLITYGYGDGGGGPTELDLEYLYRMNNGLFDCPKVKPEFAGDFLRKITEDFSASRKKPTWAGELYLEYHRGTYTTIAKNKRYNRLGEYLLQNAECLCAALSVIKGKVYPKAKLDSCWETLLTNQFHDIIPGSSIGEVYRDSDISYAKMFSCGADIINGARRELLSDYDTKDKIAIFNKNNFKNDGYVAIDGEYNYYEGICGNGFKLFDKNMQSKTFNMSMGDFFLENEALRVDFDGCYNIISIIDKSKNRQLVRCGGLVNRIVCYEEPESGYDAWDIKRYYSEKSHTDFETQIVERINKRNVVGFRVKRKIFSSTLTQSILLIGNSSKIDFLTEVDWKEEHLLMKSESDLYINTDKAVCDIQFGVIERDRNTNTSWEQAKFEVCAHKFVDLSEGNYGVALINDCKYGYGLQADKLTLSLLRSPTYPYADADKCKHILNYELYIHEGNYYNSNVMAEAYKFNKPLEIFECDEHVGKQESEFCLFEVDCESVMLDTVKMAEDGSGIILRLFETVNSRHNVNVKCRRPFKSAHECDLMELKTEKLSAEGNSLNLNFNPFEIKTLKIIF